MYRKSDKGLQFLYIYNPSPIIHTNIVVRTRADDDKGKPHTLEHLVFMGSKNYPYKGTLDSIANLTYAQGTNAWTDIDHTAYTASQCSVEGTVHLLKVFLDHLLQPLMTDSAYVTEVHHFTSAGQSMGVVVGEMQARQNTMEDLSELALHRALYGGSSYQYEIGGFVKELRRLTVQECRDFHKQHYYPDNMLIIISGGISQEQFDSLVKEVDLSLDYTSTMKGNPWADHQLKPFLKDNEVMVEFPSEDESIGGVQVGWRIGKQQEHQLDVLWEYLTDSAVSVMDKVFVQEGLSSGVSYHIRKYSDQMLAVEFDGVPSEKLTTIVPLMYSKLNGLNIDIERMRSLIKRSIQQIKQRLETDPTDYLMFKAIPVFLYSDKMDFSSIYEDIKMLEGLLDKDAQFWNLLLQNLLKHNKVAIISKPNSSLSDKLSQEEKQFQKEFKAKHSEDQLKEYDFKVKAAKEQNEVAPPAEVLGSVPDCAVSSLIEPQSSQVSASQSVLYLHNVKSEFVELECILDTSPLNVEERKYLLLMLEIFFELPMIKDGKQLSADEVVSMLDKETLSYDLGFGFNAGGFSKGNFSQYLVLKLELSADKYQTGVQWCFDLLHNTVFDEAKVKIGVIKTLTEFAEMARSGSQMLNDMKSVTLYEDSGNVSSCSMIKQKSFLEAIKEKANYGDVGRMLKQVLDKMLSTAQMHFVGKVKPDTQVPWNSLFKDCKKEQNIKYISQVRKDFSQSLGKLYVMSMPAIEGSFGSFIIEAIDQFVHKDYAALMTLVEYLSAMEGLLWKGVRGTGLAYGTSLSLNVESGQLSLSIYRSPDALKAHQAVVQIFSDLLSGSGKFDDISLKGAKSSLIYTIVQREDNLQSAAYQDFIAEVFKQQPKDKRTRFVLDQINQVTLQDLQAVMSKYLSKFVAVKQNVGFVTTMPSLVESMTAGWKQSGYEIVNVPTLAVLQEDESDEE